MRIKRTIALDISPIVRAQVYTRDSWDGAPCCICCGSPHNLTIAHVIARSQSGLGIVENLATLCIADHELYDHGTPEQRKHMKQLIEGHMVYCYGNEWYDLKKTYERSE